MWLLAAHYWALMAVKFKFSTKEPWEKDDCTVILKFRGGERFYQGDKIKFCQGLPHPHPMQMKSCQPEINITLNLQEMQVAKKVILLDIVQYDESNFLRGELLESYNCQNTEEVSNYRVCRSCDLLLFCKADDVAPLQEEQFDLLEAITNPLHRFEVFRHTLEWGMSLRDGAIVWVTLPTSPPTYARAIVRYRGPLGEKHGTFFGVEIMVCSYIPEVVV